MEQKTRLSRRCSINWRSAQVDPRYGVPEYILMWVAATQNDTIRGLVRVEQIDEAQMDLLRYWLDPCRRD